MTRILIWFFLSTSLTDQTKSHPLIRNTAPSLPQSNQPFQTQLIQRPNDHVLHIFQVTQQHITRLSIVYKTPLSELRVQRTHLVLPRPAKPT